LWLGVPRAAFTDLQNEEVVDYNFFIWAHLHMLTVSKALYEMLEPVVAKSKPSPFNTTGRGHLMSNIHPDALEVKARHPTAAPATAS